MCSFVKLFYLNRGLVFFPQQLGDDFSHHVMFCMIGKSLDTLATGQSKSVINGGALAHIISLLQLRAAGN